MISNWLIILCYCIMAYGACNVIVFGSGPFKIFENLRLWTYRLNPHFGSMFSCMMCLPTNFGLIFSLVDWFLMPNIAIAPFNILLGPLGGAYWILAMLCDGAFTSGIVWFIHNIESLFEKGAEKFDSESVYDEEQRDDILQSDDITAE